MQAQCTVCQKEINGYEIYGPLHWPLCWHCFVKHEGDILDIIKSQPQSTVARHIRELSDPGAKDIDELDKQIEALEEEVDDLTWELHLAKGRLDDLRLKKDSQQKSHSFA